MSKLLGKKRVSFEESNTTIIPVKSIDSDKYIFDLSESNNDKPVRFRFDNGYEIHVKKYIGLLQK